MYELNVEKLTKDQKTFVLQFLPPANVRELLVHMSVVRDLSHAELITCVT